MTDVSYRYLVEVKVDGSILVHPDMPEELAEADRTATAGDIVSSSLKLAHDIDQQIVVDRITDTVAESIQLLAQGFISAFIPEPEPTVPDQVKTALKERGITPDNAEESV